MKQILLYLLILTSCNNSNKVKFIISDNFKGVFRVSQSSQGKDVLYKDGFYIYEIGNSLDIKFKDIKPLEYVSYIEVETTSGKPLKAWPPNNKTLDFHNLGITSEGNIHYGVFSIEKLDLVRKDAQYQFDVEKFNRKFFHNSIDIN